VVVLQHVRTSRARTELLQALVDRDESVRELAALGLALQGDSRVVPTLKGLYRTADEGGAAAACVALERLGTPEAITALAELAPGHADADRRAALVDALGGIGQPECVPPLIELLSDERVCSGLPRALRAARGVLGDLAATGRLAIDAGSLPTQAAAQTVAERAAAALTRITGLNSPFASSAPAAERERAAQTWREWYRQRRGRP
jgi:HEAT repeat protein